MKNMKLFLKISVFAQIVTALLLFSLPVSESYARAGCCARHGGVAGCNSATNHQQCKDGSDSVSCMCDGSKATKSVFPAAKETRAAKAARVKTEKSAKAADRRAAKAAEAQAAANAGDPKAAAKAKAAEAKATKAAKAAETKAAKATKAAQVKADKTKAKADKAKAKADKVKAKADKVKAKAAKATAGCCARHGGVARCNKSTGFQMCKDGSASASCRC